MTLNELVVGASLRQPLGPGKIRLQHVRGFVDDQIVCRYWRAAKKRWEYVVFDSETIKTWDRA